MSAGSFSAGVKAELCRLQVSKQCDALAELYGMVLFATVFTSSELRILSACEGLPKRVALLLRAAFGAEAPEPKLEKLGRGRLSLTLRTGEGLEKLRTALGYGDETRVALHLNGWIVWEECCRSAFLRGAFLTGGYITDPERQYHLELSSSHAALMREIAVLFSEMELSPKSMIRKSENLLYFRGTEQIEAYLARAGAHRAVLDLNEALVIKDVRNRINRSVNCETANIFRTVETCREQLKAIEKLENAGILETLDERLRAAAELRREYPDESIGALAALAHPPMSKSGLNHRLASITALAEKLTSGETAEK